MTEEVSFEKAFNRLEEILQKMNETTISLDNSLKLFEEANNLIIKCNDKLNAAEQKIEILLKNKHAQLELDNESPKTENFEYDREKILDN